ncbi:hypothetical protein FFLO_03191 [Filobasidium floriforme]|uniref:Uncharacterized protein n=1 Tax=Filobasidium floriforme TaxID=5210 RepID=A0A8K0JN60_9TREE|nr:uncharacterized protein HD553DRAFT_351673 [Filobasidium floriforme]KAG7548899.1 hypothetical protein FFLO_03191 [Filobasidium floriforme]KAH8081111.1 hypothetical protein HD553DRAFT_351673 [Filobasidium floriforme]
MRATWISRLQESLKSPKTTASKSAKLSAGVERRPRPTDPRIAGPMNTLSLKSLPPTRNVLKLCKVQWITAGRAMMSNPKGVSCHSPHFHLRATPSTEMPMPTASAFGPPRRPPKEFTPFAILTTIKGVSKRAVQRNRVRTRFKEAVRLVLTRDARAANNKEGEIAVPLSQIDEAWEVDLLLEGHYYSAQLEPGVYSAPMPELVNQVRQSLLSIKHKKSLKEARGSSKAVSKPKPQRAATPK